MAADFLERMGARMRERREELNLSRADVARKMPGKVSENQIYRWEKGQHQPNPDTLQALAATLDCDVAYFMSGPRREAPTETPDLSKSSDAERLDRIEAKLDQLLAAIGVDNAGRGDLSDQIIRTVEKALNQRASEVGRSPKRAGRVRPEQPHRGAA